MLELSFPSEEGAERIARSVASKTNVAAMSAAIQEAADFYRIEKDRQQRPSEAEFKAALRSLGKQTKALSKSLDALDSHTRTLLSSALQRQDERNHHESGYKGFVPLGNEPLPRDEQFDTGARWLKHLDTTIDNLLSRMDKTRRGRKANTALQWFVLELASIYEIHCGAPAYGGFFYDAEAGEYGGPFFLFASQCLSYADPDNAMSNNAIGDAIRRELGGKR